MLTTSSLLVNEYAAADVSHPVIVIEAPEGQARARYLAECLREFSGGGSRTFHLSCAFAEDGPWAGVTQLFASLLDEIQRESPDLLRRHAFELVYILPTLRRTLPVVNPNLTDLSSGPERTRNYPADRATRNVHGLIDLLDEWKGGSCRAASWVIACDFFDDAGAMSSLFFRELIRRRSKKLNIRLLLGVAPGHGRAACRSFDAGVETELLAPRLEAVVETSLDRAAAARLAEEIERRIGDDELELQANVPRLFSLWKQAVCPDKVLHYQFAALETYNTLGLYADALRYSAGMLALAKKLEPVNYAFHWSIFIKVLMCHLGLNDFDSSLEIIENVGLALAPRETIWQEQLFYLMAMLYARFKKPRDLEKGEEYLEQGLAITQTGEMPAGKRHFHYVFNRNGLAMIRNFQRRPQEAIELCRAGFAYLNEHLGQNEHRLHRSILLYNIAQVYAASGAHEEALQYFTDTIAMDPNYSEYYNERANALLHLDRLEEAAADYRRAIELSPPYFEVFTNLGQCYRRMGAMEKAVEQYSRALDIEPTHLLARLGRAKAHEEIGERDAAIVDYSAVISLDGSLWEALASRGVLYYEAGRLQDSLADIDAAIALSPENGDLHENRAVVLADLAAAGVHYATAV